MNQPTVHNKINKVYLENRLDDEFNGLFFLFVMGENAVTGLKIKCA